MILIELPNGKILFAAFILIISWDILDFFPFYSSIQINCFSLAGICFYIENCLPINCRKDYSNLGIVGRDQFYYSVYDFSTFLNTYMIEIFLDLITFTLYANQLLWLQLIYINILYTNENIDSYSLIRNMYMHG